MLLVYLSLAWLAGILLASIARVPLFLWGLWLVLPAGLFFLFRNNLVLRRVHLYIFVFLLGALRYTASIPQFDERALAFYNNRGDMTLIGEVVEPPDVRDRTTNVRVNITRIRPPSLQGVRFENRAREVNGLALLQVPRETDVRFGDQIQIFGEPVTPFESEEFSYKEYLARQGIHSIIRSYSRITILARDQGNPFYTALYAFKARALTTVYAIFPDPAASLLAGILLGVDSGIPREVSNAFSATNTAHIVAISGFNVSIVAGLLSKLAKRLTPAYAVTGIVIGGLVIYTLLVGASPSVVRAAIMGALSVLALHFGRQNDALNALAASAVLMTAQNPSTIYDLSFLLSFLATLGLVLYVTPLTNWFEIKITQLTSAERAKQIVGVLSDALIVTLAAQITTTPLIIFAFHRLSLIGLLTNFLVLPVQPPLMIWGGLATLVGMIAPPVGQVIAWIAWTFLEWTIVIVQATASLPFSSIEVGRFDLPILGMYYLILFGAARVDWKSMSRRTIIPPAIALGIALVAGVWLWNVALTAPDGKTHVEFIDGNNAATFIRTPQGKKILIDGGENPSVVLSRLGERMPFWDRALDLIVLTSPNDSHILGLVPTLDRYDVGQIVQTKEPPKPSAAYIKWQQLIAQKRVAVLSARSGLQIALDQNVILEFLTPPDDAGASPAIARLQVGNFGLLFAESAGAEEQAALRASDQAASALLVAPRKVSVEFVDAVNPQYAIIFSGKSTREQPSADLLAVLSRATILRTDERGTIEFILDGQTLVVRTTR